MFGFFGRRRALSRWGGGAERTYGVCIECGQPRRNYYLRCDACAQSIWQQLLNAPDQPTQLLPAQPAMAATPGEQVDRAYLANVPEGEAVADDTPFATPLLTYPALPALPWQTSMLTAVLVAVQRARESLPPIREDWSGRCPWCAREMRELSDDLATHQPQRATLATCDRHRAGLLALCGCAWRRLSDAISIQRGLGAGGVTEDQKTARAARHHSR